jgi:hypothetical protein
MSKIALSPNASGTGTFTFAAPGTNTDRTLTLPDAAGSVVVNEGNGTFKINSSGSVSVATTTSTPGLNNTTVGSCLNSNGTVLVSADSAGSNFNRNEDGGVMTFRRSGSAVGSISVTTSATSYNTSSDYRLKENVQPMQDALAVIAQLNPVTYTWKVDGSEGQGFIAHELQAVVPDCVTGEKDAVDAEGNPQYQGVDTSFLVATLVKAVQELTARIAALEAN